MSNNLGTFAGRDADRPFVVERSIHKRGSIMRVTVRWALWEALTTVIRAPVVWDGSEIPVVADLERSMADARGRLFFYSPDLPVAILTHPDRAVRFEVPIEWGDFDSLVRGVLMVTSGDFVPAHLAPALLAHVRANPDALAAVVSVANLAGREEAAAYARGLVDAGHSSQVVDLAAERVAREGVGVGLLLARRTA